MGDSKGLMDISIAVRYHGDFRRVQSFLPSVSHVGGSGVSLSESAGHDNDPTSCQFDMERPEHWNSTNDGVLLSL